MRYSRKGMKRTTKLTVTVLQPARKGANARGTCAHKRTKGARAAKAQLQTGYAPTPVTAYLYRLDKV